MEEELFTEASKYSYRVDDADVLPTEYIQRAAEVAMKKGKSVYLLHGDYRLRMSGLRTTKLDNETGANVAILFPRKNQLKDPDAFEGLKKISLGRTPWTTVFDYIDKFKTIIIPPLKDSVAKKYEKRVSVTNRSVTVQRLHVLLNWYPHLQYKDLQFYETEYRHWLTSQMKKPESKITWGTRIRRKDGMCLFVYTKTA